jgi:phosphoribosylaminoimidazole (AIR) synthetase
MHYCQDLGNVPDNEAYRTWNMGNGMVVSTPEPDKVIDVAKEYGINAKVIGAVNKSNEISIRNKGFNNATDFITHNINYN